MPLGAKPQCASCQTLTSNLWRRNSKGETQCLGCFSKVSNGASDQPGNGQNGTNGKRESSNGNHSNNGVVLRKSTRARVTKARYSSQAKSGATKGKGRRIIFKKSATKAPTSVATPVTTECIFYKGTYYQTGDVVSMVDVHENVYYAQIRGLLQDQYCEKSAVITWLLPTMSSPQGHFDPTTYIIGPEEELPRKLECMEFVCHAPSEYFKSKSSPYPTISTKPELCFIWTRFGPQIRPVKTNDTVS